MRISDKAETEVVQTGEVDGEIGVYGIVGKGLQVSTLGAARASDLKGQYRSSRSIPP